MHMQCTCKSRDISHDISCDNDTHTLLSTHLSHVVLVVEWRQVGVGFVLPGQRTTLEVPKTMLHLPTPPLPRYLWKRIHLDLLPGERSGGGGKEVHVHVREEETEKEHRVNVIHYHSRLEQKCTLHVRVHIVCTCQNIRPIVRVD